MNIKTKEKTKKVVLVGGNGLLGSSLAPSLIKNGYTVLVVSRSLTVNYGLNYSAGCGVDFTDRNETCKFLDQVKPDTIVNLAASTNVDNCEKNPHDAYLQNCKIIENIADWATYSKNTHLIQISTDMVYDNPGFNSESNICIRNHYAMSKLAGELAAKNCFSTILRTNFFGRSQCENRTSFTDWIYSNLIKKNPIQILTDVDFSPLSLDTLCNSINLVISNPITGTYNLGAKTLMSKSDFCIYFVKKLFPNYLNLMTPVSLQQLNLAAPRPRSMSMNSNLFELTFNTKLPDLENELNHVVKDYKK